MATASPGPHCNKRPRRDCALRPSTSGKYLFGLLAFVFNVRISVAANCEGPPPSTVLGDKLGGYHPLTEDALPLLTNQHPRGHGAEGGPRVPPTRAGGFSGLLGSISVTSVMTSPRMLLGNARTLFSPMEWPRRLWTRGGMPAGGPTSRWKPVETVYDAFAEDELRDSDCGGYVGLRNTSDSVLPSCAYTSFTSSALDYAEDCLGQPSSRDDECAGAEGDLVIDALRMGAAWWAALFSVLTTVYAMCLVRMALPNVWRYGKALPVGIRFPVPRHPRCRGHTLFRAWSTGPRQPRRVHILWNREARRRRAKKRWIRDAEPAPYAKRFCDSIGKTATRIRHFIYGASSCMHWPAAHRGSHGSGLRACPDRHDAERPRSQGPKSRRGNTRGQRLWVRALIAMALWWAAAAAPSQETDFYKHETIAEVGGSKPTMTRGSYNLLWDQRDVQRAKSAFRVAHCDVNEGQDGPRPGYMDDAETMLSVITANVHSLNHRVEEVMTWDADVVLLQETKLTAHAIKDIQGVVKREGWTMVHGKPCPPGVGGAGQRKTRTSAVTEANRGGVAALVRAPKKPIAHPFNKHAQDLVESARWQRVKIPLAHGARCLTASTVYGISGANDDARKKRQNEDLIAAAINDALDAGDDPYLICGDANVDPEDSPSIAAAVEAGLLVDIGHAWAATQSEDEHGNVVKIPDPTFSSHGPVPGMTGPGVSRLDVILANPVAAAAVVNFVPRWDLVQVDHVPLQVIMKVRDLAATEVVHKAPEKILTDHLPPDWSAKWDEAVDKAYSIYGNSFDAAVDNQRLDDAHEIWNYMAEAVIKIAAGGDPDQVRSDIQAAPIRGAPPRFIKRQRRKPVDRLGTPETFLQRQATNVRNRVNDLRNRLRKSDAAKGTGTMWKVELEGKCDYDVEMTLWNTIEARSRRLLGIHRLEEIVHYDRDHLPDMESLNAIAAEMMKIHNGIGVRKKTDRKAHKKSAEQWDWERNHGRRAYAQARLAYTPPPPPPMRLRTPAAQPIIRLRRELSTTSYSPFGVPSIAPMPLGIRSGIGFSLSMGSTYRRHHSKIVRTQPKTTSTRLAG